MKIILLCGAHKTASTHFQRTLSGNSARLLQSGVHVIPPKVVRVEIMPIVDRARRIRYPAGIKSELSETLKRLAPDAATLLICDENLLGGTDPAMGFRGGQLYPWAARRIARLVRLLPSDQVRLAMAVRCMATFLPSAYGENLYHRPYATFGDYLEGVDPQRLTWSHLMMRLLHETRCPLSIWRYEDYPAIIRAVLADLLGHGVARDVAVSEKPARIGLSAAAIEAMAKAHLLGEAQPDLTALKKQFPKSVTYPGFSPFADAEVQRLSRFYKKDMAAIAAMPNVRVVSSRHT